MVQLHPLHNPNAAPGVCYLSFELDNAEWLNGPKCENNIQTSKRANHLQRPIDTTQKCLGRRTCQAFAGICKGIDTLPCTSVSGSGVVF